MCECAHSELKQALINGPWSSAGIHKRHLNKVAPPVSECNCISAIDLWGIHCYLGVLLMKIPPPLNFLFVICKALNLFLNGNYGVFFHRFFFGGGMSFVSECRIFYSWWIWRWYKSIFPLFFTVSRSFPSHLVSFQLATFDSVYLYITYNYRL